MQPHKIYFYNSIDLLDLRALIGFERWQSANKGLPLWSVKDHLGSIGVVEASRMEVVLDGTSPPRFGGGLWVFSSHGYFGHGHRHFVQGGRSHIAIYILHGGHIVFQNGRYQKLYLINPYFTSPTQLLACPVLSRSSIVLFERYCQNKIFEGVHFEIQIDGPKSFPFKWKHWFLVSGMSELSKNIFGSTLHKIRTNVFFLT